MNAAFFRYDDDAPTSFDVTWGDRVEFVDESGRRCFGEVCSLRRLPGDFEEVRILEIDGEWQRIPLTREVHASWLRVVAV